MPLLDGKKLAEFVSAQTKGLLATLTRRARLCVLLVGNDPASMLYVSLKKKVAENLGITMTIEHVGEETTDQKLLTLLETWNHDPLVDAILIQLPLPPNHETRQIVHAIDPKKDVDGFHPNSSIFSPSHQAVLTLLNAAPYRVSETKVAILANSNVFADPLVRLLKKAGAEVECFLSNDIHLPSLASTETIVTAIGKPKFLQKKDVPNARVLIDVGTSRDEQKKLCGDVDIESFLPDDHVWISPVPGGVGPLTVAFLMQNVMRLARQHMT